MNFPVGDTFKGMKHNIPFISVTVAAFQAVQSVGPAEFSIIRLTNHIFSKRTAFTTLGIGEPPTH
jgi:hypothetical protein